MARNGRSIMSEELKLHLADELGVGDVVRREGFGAVSSKDCGKLVKLAIEHAESVLQNRQQ